MDYLDWIKALDRAYHYAELNGTTLTSLHKTGAVFKSCGYLSHDDISSAIIAASQQRDEPAFGYCVYDQNRGWIKTDTMPQELDGFFRNFEKPRIKCGCDNVAAWELDRDTGIDPYDRKGHPNFNRVDCDEVMK